MSTKIISEKPIVSGDFFTVNEVNLELKDGTKRTYKNIYRKPSVSVFPLDENDNIYLIKQYRYMLKDYIVETISGMIDTDEDPLQAAIRELEEEGGLVAKTVKEIAALQSAASIIIWKKHLFVATGITETIQNLEADEDITVLKIPLEKAVDMALHKEFISNDTVTGILLINELKRRGEL